MKKIFIFFLLGACAHIAEAQSKPKAKKDSCIAGSFTATYIFNSNRILGEVDATGRRIEQATTVTAFKGYLFTVEAVNVDDCTLTIHFLNFKDTIARLEYNNVSKDELSRRVITENENSIQNAADNSSKQSSSVSKDRRYFRLSKDDFDNYCEIYTGPQNRSWEFGTFTVPFKFRPTKSLWSNGLSLGTTAIYKIQRNVVQSYGLLLGISIGSVSLDSLSTNYTVKTSTERPAFTPSIGAFYAYKNIFFTGMLGIDYINRTSVIEQSWIFNKKPWLGFGIGVNLFTAGNGEEKGTKKAKGQDTP